LEARGGGGRIGDETAVDAGEENGASDSEEQRERDELIIFADSSCVDREIHMALASGGKGRKLFRVGRDKALIFIEKIKHGK
jgi:hypothetical protein